MKKATIKDVAKAAGVSVATVSAYLNGVTIRPENYVRVEQAVKELHYSMNYVAKSMKTQKSYTVGVVVPQLGDAYSGSILSEIEKILYEHGYNLMICDSGAEKEKELERIRFLASRSVDGLFLFPSQREYGKGLGLPEGLPLITLDGRIEGYDSVCTGDRQSVARAVGLLKEKGHRRIAFFNGPLHFFTAQERYSGYMDGLKAAGLPLVEELVSNRSFGREVSLDMGRMLALPQPPTAVIASNYYTTLGLLHYAGEEGISIPEELSVVGMDKMEMISLFYPGLSVIERPAQAMGRLAGERMLRRLLSPEGRELPPEDFLLENSYFPGSTAGAPASSKEEEKESMEYFLL